MLAPMQRGVGSDLSRGLQGTCSQCRLREICLPCGLDAEGLQLLEQTIGAPRSIRRGESLYRAGDPFRAIFVVKTGFFKTVLPIDDGRFQIIGFQMGGEILGMDGIGGDIHGCDAVALEDSKACPIPFAELETVLRTVPNLQRRFNKFMGREINHDHGMMMLLGVMRAEERLAVFLLNLSRRFAVSGFSPVEFQLRMMRGEIGAYLGMKEESVSRAFTVLQTQGLISVQNKHVRMLEMARLRALVEQY